MDEELKKALAELSTKIDDLKKDNTRRHNLIRFESMGIASGALAIATVGLYLINKDWGDWIAALVFLIIGIGALVYSANFKEKK